MARMIPTRAPADFEFLAGGMTHYYTDTFRWQTEYPLRKKTKESWKYDNQSAS